MNIAKELQNEFQLKTFQVENTIQLMDEGNTIPFIARYRKEKTGSLDDTILREFYQRLQYLRTLQEKKEQITESIKEQGKLTEEIQKQLVQATTLVELEDIYRPFRPKRRTRATIAKEKGLEPLAQILWTQKKVEDIVALAQEYVNSEKEVMNSEEALQGAQDILAEQISDEPLYRQYIRKLTFQEGTIATKVKDDTISSVYEMYYDYEEAIKKIPGHRILAMNRGEKEKVLTVKIEVPLEKVIMYLEHQIIQTEQTKIKELLQSTIMDSYKRLIAPSIEREIRNELTEKAEEGALKVFSANLQQLLLQPPILNKVVLGVDPAYRTGCKIAVVDETGRVLDTTVIYPTPPQQKIEESKKVLTQWIKKYGVHLIAIGNGTASRETEQFIAEFIQELPNQIYYVIVNEAGASVYSASSLAAEEFPEFDVSLRSAVSIARRLQDPLAELVKIDPKSIGVGQYQHDMNQKRLEDTLQGVVENSVNQVGVDVNTASFSLLSYVAGVSNKVAKNIVQYREDNGIFTKRDELLKVPQLGPKAFEQCAGFLRIREGENILDNTGVHPESYSVVKKLLKKLDYTAEDVKNNKLQSIKDQVKSMDELATQLEVGKETLEDILKELAKPGRDPRTEMPQPILRQDILELEDLKEGMILEGTVRNVIDFGAFVDIGVHQDGLVHISELSDQYVKHPLDIVAVGDIVKVRVISVDVPKKRIGLSMKM
ncbi:MAG: RNA-binding transcriptional accessory protein [Epulopiscium sp.]|nr:RNA-binding transcriptional accessory protein [Candidatus Epulonipiscium sp.]